MYQNHLEYAGYGLRPLWTQFDATKAHSGNVTLWLHQLLEFGVHLGLACEQRHVGMPLATVSLSLQ